MTLGPARVKDEETKKHSIDHIFTAYLPLQVQRDPLIDFYITFFISDYSHTPLSEKNV